VKSTACRLLPDAALLHQADLAVEHVALVVGMLAGDGVGIEVLRINRFLNEMSAMVVAVIERELKIQGDAGA